MRAFYRIKRSDWPLTISDGGGGTMESKVGAIPIGGTQALLIVHSSVYPNAALESLTASKFLGNTYAELLDGPHATATQKAKVFESSYLGSTGDRKRAKTADVPSTAVVVRANLIPHSWGGRESQTEQAAVDDLG